MKIVLEEFYSDLTPESLEDRKSEIDEFKSEIYNKNFVIIKEKFHEITGSGGGYGFSQLSDYAIKIEEAAIKNDIDTIQATFKDYTKYLNSVELVFE